MMDRPANIPEIIVETDTVAIAREVARFAVELRFPVHIVGKPGTGKSSALWHIAKQMGGTYCEISDPTKNTKGLYELLLRSIGKWDRQKYIRDLADDTFHYFAPREEFEIGGGRKLLPRFLVVDEVQTLEPTAFRELLRIQEKCELGLVLAGNAERLAGSNKKDASTWAQIESRIALRRVLPGPSHRDCELIGSTCNLEGKEAYEALANFGMRTNFRDVSQLLEAARRLCGGATGIRQHHLEAALRLLNPKPEAVKLLKNEAA